MLPLATSSWDEEEYGAIHRVISSDRFTMGPEVEAFEKEFAEFFGSKSQTKREIITEIAATLAFSALQNNDKVGVIMFSGQVELYISEYLEKKKAIMKEDIQGPKKVNI